MKHQLIIFLIILIQTIGCNSESNDNQKNSPKKEKFTLRLNDLAGKVYFFGPEFDSTKCYPTGACDCCTDNILFLDHKNFITISYCESDEDIGKGTYKLNKNNIELTYDSLQISRDYNWEIEIDSTKKQEPEYIVKEIKSKPVKVKLTSFLCHGKINLNVDNESFGSIDNETTLKEFINILKKDGTWEKLK